MQLIHWSRRIRIMHITRWRDTRNTARHTTLRSRRNRDLTWRIQIQRIKRILLSRGPERVIKPLLSHILSPCFRTLERRRRSQLMRILSIPVIIRRDFPELRRDIRKMTFRSWIFSSGELIGPTCQFEGCMVS